MQSSQHLLHLRSVWRRLSVRRLARYLALWLRYLWLRARGDFSGGQPERAPGIAALDGSSLLDWREALDWAIASWNTLDLVNARPHAALIAELAVARPELALNAEVRNCIAALKRAPNLAQCVDKLAAIATPRSVNTALYVLLLRRLPAPEELPMIERRHPRTALIAMLSGDEYLRQGRRTVPV